MKIKEIIYGVHEMNLKEPYLIAYEEVFSCDNVFLRLGTDNDQVGYGCAAPDIHITGETSDDVIHFLENTIIPIIKGADLMDYQRINEDIKASLGPAMSTRAMVDMAIMDLMARTFRTPLCRYLGGYRKSIPTSITVGILDMEKTLIRVKEYLQEGFTIIKLKGGLALQEDLEKIRMLRNKLGYHFTIRFDANQGYSVEDAISFVKSSEPYRIEILEQPTPYEKIDDMAKVTSQVSIPVMADESLRNIHDAFHLASREVTDMINIKLMKVGGINDAIHINSVVKSAGIEAMVGCLDESALGISAGLHFALSRKNIIYADLDGHLDIIDDPFAGIFQLKKGVLYPDNSPGLGPINENKLKKLL